MGVLEQEKVWVGWGGWISTGNAHVTTYPYFLFCPTLFLSSNIHHSKYGSKERPISCQEAFPEVSLKLFKLYLNFWSFPCHWMQCMLHQYHYCIIVNGGNRRKQPGGLFVFEDHCSTIISNLFQRDTIC